MREIRTDVEKQLADRRQVLRSPDLRLGPRDVYKKRCAREKEKQQ